MKRAFQGNPGGALLISTVVSDGRGKIYAAVNGVGITIPVNTGNVIGSGPKLKKMLTK